MISTRKPLIVDPKEEDEVWTVYPTPGLCVKYREAKLPNESLPNVGPSTTSKFFINLTHCVELPPPKVDLEEDDAAKLMDENPEEIRIPISLGELDWAEDKTGERAAKVDVLVNSNFFTKRICSSDFFRQLTLMIAIQAIEQRHGIVIDPAKQVVLRNRKFIGELNAQKVRKQPKLSFKGGNPQNRNPLIEEAPSSSRAGEEPTMDIDDVEDEGAPKRPRNYKVQILGGKTADIKIRVRDPESNELVMDAKRLTLKMNDDRVVLLLDGQRTVADFFVPYSLFDDQAKCDFDPMSATISIECPVNWGQ